MESNVRSRLRSSPQAALRIPSLLAGIQLMYHSRMLRWSVPQHFRQFVVCDVMRTGWPPLSHGITVVPRRSSARQVPAVYDASRLLGWVFVSWLDSGAVDQPPELGVVDVVDDFAGHDHVDGLIDDAAAYDEPLGGVIVQAVPVNQCGVEPDLGEHAVK